MLFSSHKEALFSTKLFSCDISNRLPNVTVSLFYMTTLIFQIITSFLQDNMDNTGYDKQFVVFNGYPRKMDSIFFAR